MTSDYQNLEVRKALESDMMEIFNLANEKTVRESSFYSEKISLDKHKEWFSKKLSDQNCLLLIVELDGRFAGQLRFDIEGRNATVGISLCPKSRGKGIAKRLLGIGIERVRKEFPRITTVLAYVKPGNTASARLFEKAGFLLKEQTERNGCDALFYIYQIKGDN